MQALSLSLLQSVRDSRNELVLEEERRRVGCFGISVCCCKGNVAYGDLVLCDLLLQNPSLHEQNFSFFHSLKLIVEQIPRSCN